MKQICWGALVVIVVSVPLAFGQYEGLVINEILPNPRNAAGAYVDANQDGVTNVFDDEFIELLNTSTNSIDVAGLWITDVYTNIRRHVFSSRILPPGGSIVVFGGGSLLGFTQPPAQIAAGGGLSLNNDTETVYLFSSQTTVVDQVSYQLTASHDAISTVRNPDGTGPFTNHYRATTNTLRASPGRQVHGLPFLTNQPPVLLDLSDQTAFVGLELQFPVRAYDPADGDAITLSVIDNPANSTFSSTGGVGTFAFTAGLDQVAQIYDVAFVASDVDGAETNTISIRVVNPNSSEDVWINEIHYDNVGDDVDEGVEIAGTAGSVLTEYSLILYNGLNGNFYSSNALTGTLDDEQCGFGATWFAYPPNGLQNGPSDGIALVKGTNVIQFLSYDGVLTASNGPTLGMTSIDIGVHESATTPVGYSLQLIGTGTTYSAFTWVSARPHSRGNLNTGQEIECLAPAAIEIQKTVYLGHDGGASAPGVESVQGTNGAAVTYVFVVSNTGGSAITNVWISDASLGIPPIELGTLTTGAVSTTVVEAVISGDLRNTATVSGEDSAGAPLSDEDTAEVLEFIPNLDIQITVYHGHDGGASCPGFDFLQATNGTPVTYCFVVENNGTTNVNSLTVSAPALGIPDIEIGTLEAGGQFSTSVESVVTGTLTNTATVNGLDPNSDPVSDQDSAIVEMISPALLLQKTVYLGHDSGASCPGVELVSGTNGTPITYCFLVSNIGDSPLTNAVLRDAGLSGFPDTGLGMLADGESTNLYFETTISSSFVNSATATAFTVLGDLVLDMDSATVQLSIPTNDFGYAEYEVVNLGTLGGTSSEALGVNDRSQVVGWAKDIDGCTQAFLWQDNSMSGLGFLPGGTASVAMAINNHGDITGYAYVSPTNFHSFLYSTGTMTSIRTWGSAYSLARAINDQCVIAGSSPPNNKPTINSSFLWKSSQFVEIPAYVNGNSCDAFGINQEGLVSGITFVYSPNPRWWAYVWADTNSNFTSDAGEMKLLGSLGTKNSVGEWSAALDVNDNRQAVGWTGITNWYYPTHAFLVTFSNGVWKLPSYSNIDPTNLLMQDLGVLGGPTNNSKANALNNQTWIVGTADLQSGTNHAFLWRNGTMADLNTLIYSNSGWVLTNATGINEHNEIVGSGLYLGQQRAFMLRQGGHITHVISIFQTNTWVYTNDLEEAVTQSSQRVVAQELQWAGIWGTNPPNKFTVEYSEAVTNHVWMPFAPTSQWPIFENFWTNTDFNATNHKRFFRIRAQDN